MKNYIVVRLKLLVMVPLLILVSLILVVRDSYGAQPDYGGWAYHCSTSQDGCDPDIDIPSYPGSLVVKPKEPGHRIGYIAVRAETDTIGYSAIVDADCPDLSIYGLRIKTAPDKRQVELFNEAGQPIDKTDVLVHETDQVHDGICVIEESLIPKKRFELMLPVILR